MIALTLAVVLTTITALIARKRLEGEAARPFFPTVPLIALQNALMLFGATVAAAVLWQRVVGTVTVSPITAAALALFAAAVTAVVHVRTMVALRRG